MSHASEIFFKTLSILILRLIYVAYFKFTPLEGQGHSLEFPPTAHLPIPNPAHSDPTYLQDPHQHRHTNYPMQNENDGTQQ